MNEQNDTSRDRLEGVLRRWGAEQAAGDAAAGLPKAPKSTKRSLGLVLLRWVPTAAAAGLLLAAGAILILARMGYRGGMGSVTPDKRGVARTQPRQGAGDTHVGVLPTTGPAIADLSRQLAEARAEAAEARNALSDVLADKVASDQQIKDLQGKWTDLQRKTAGEHKQWALTEAKLMTLIRATEQSAADARGELKKVRKDLTIATAAAGAAGENREELKRVKVRLAAAVDELKRQQETFRKANEQRTKAHEELASLKARYNAALDQIRAVYLSAGAPGKTGLAALQETVTRRDLLKRCAVLQRRARTGADKKLLGRAEVALTRLCLLDTSDSVAVQAFVRQLAAGDLIASLDAALGPLAADARMQDWLFETKLILTGVQRVI